MGVDAHAARAVQGQPGALQPSSAPGLGHPKHRVGAQPFAGCAGRFFSAVNLHRRIADLRHPHAGAQLHTTRLQHLGKTVLHAPVMGGQDGVAGRKQEELGHWLERAQGLAFKAQPMLHRQQQLYPPGAGAHYRNRTRPRSGAHRAQQRQPALVERANRFDAHGMFVCPRRRGGLWRGAGVDGQQVVVQSRTATQHHLAPRAVDACHFGAHKTRSGKNAQAHQVQMNGVKVIVARHIARQHA